jgi:hypothetical protein
MSENQLDELLKNRMLDHRSPVPENMWERIVQKKDRDRKLFIFFLRSLLIVLLAACLVGVFNNQLFHTTSNPDKGKIDSGKVFRAQLRDAGQPEVVKQQEPAPAFKTADKKIKSTAYIKINPLNTTGETQPGSGQNDSQATDSIHSSNQKADSVISPFNKKQTTDSTRGAVSKTPEKNKTPDHKKWYLDLYISPDLPLNSQVANPYFLVQEQMKLSYSIGLKLNRSFGKHFSGKIGLEYAQINFSLSDSNGSNTYKNHLRSLDLPVLAGYSIGNDKFKATLDAGLVFNLYSWYKGDSLTNYFKTNTGLSLYIGLNFEEKVSDRISVFGEPYYRYRLSSMTINIVEFNKFIDVVGISLGARYYFKK